MKLKETFLLSCGICMLLVLSFFQYQTLKQINQLSDANNKLEAAVLTQSSIPGSSGLKQEITNQGQVLQDRFEKLHSKMEDLEQRYSEFKEEVQLQVVSLSEDQSLSAQSLRKKILEIEHELFYMTESLRFFLPQLRLSSAQLSALSSDVQNRIVKNGSVTLQERNLSEVGKESSRMERFPVLKFIQSKGYRLFHDGEEILILKDKGVQEHLAYQLTALFLPGENPVPTRYLYNYEYEGEVLHGTLQKFLQNVVMMESEQIHSMNQEQIQEVYRVLLIDYILGNQERDFLYSAKMAQVIGVDVDEAFDFEFDDWFKKETFYHQLLVVTAQDPVLQKWLVKEQYRLQQVSDEAIETLFRELPEKVLWDPVLARQECLEEVLKRKAKLGDFVKRILLAMRF